MNTIYKFTALVILLVSVNANANQLNKEQTEVWSVVLESYKEIDNKNVNWTDKYVTEDAMVWGGGTPMPRSRESVKRWDKFQFAAGETVVSEYSHAAIVVHNSTAIAHYYFSNGTKDAAGKQKVTHGRCSDILVKDDKVWKFVAWHCTDES